MDQVAEPGRYVSQKACSCTGTKGLSRQPNKTWVYALFIYHLGCLYLALTEALGACVCVCVCVRARACVRTRYLVWELSASFDVSAPCKQGLRETHPYASSAALGTPSQNRAAWKEARLHRGMAFESFKKETVASRGMERGRMSFSVRETTRVRAQRPCTVLAGSPGHRRQMLPEGTGT